MKRMIKAASNIDNYFKYYFDEAVEDNRISENDAQYIRQVDWSYLTEEDMDMFLDGFHAYPLSMLKKVDDAIDVGEDAGYDGAYEVTFKNGQKLYYAWYFSNTQLYPLKDVTLRRD